jgi:hypothetical protein
MVRALTVLTKDIQKGQTIQIMLEHQGIQGWYEVQDVIVHPHNVDITVIGQKDSTRPNETLNLNFETDQRFAVA